MDFSFREEEGEVAALARTILTDHATHDRLRELERQGSPYDAELWRVLARSDVLGIAIPEAHGGSGLGFLALCLVQEEVGRAVAPVPAFAALALGALPLARFGSDGPQANWLADVAAGQRVLTAALTEPASGDPLAPATRAETDDGETRVRGVKTLVPYAAQASHILVPAVVDDTGGVGLFYVEPHADGVRVTPQETPDRQPHGRVELDGARAVGRLDDGSNGDEILRWLVERAVAARCMMQLGVIERALDMTATYTRERVQFDRPIGSFQAVHQRAADAYIQLEAIRLTAWEAAWRLSEELPASEHVAVAKYVAAEGGQFASYACQHLHGGIGIDVDYPLHRYFLWAIQLEHELGSARHHLERLGRAIAGRELP